MLSEEEKKKYEEIKYNNGYLYCDKEDVDFLIDIIEKQSKEIEELKDEYNTKLLSNAGIYQLGFKDGKDSVKNKIKAKIEEIENEDKKYKNYLKDGRENFTPEYVWARPVLQSLLEKE